MPTDRYREICAAHRWRVPAQFNIAHAVCGRYADEPGRLALLWEDESGACAAYTFGDLQAGANRLSNALVARGVAPGDKVAILEGTARQVNDRPLLVRFTTDVERKYDWPMDPDALPGLVYALTPTHVLSWDATDSLGKTMTRWEV